MNVAIDTGPLSSGDSVRGVGFYTKRLIESLHKMKFGGLKIDELSSKQIRKNSGKYDVIHIPYFNPFFLTVPDGLKSKVVITIHDVIPLLFPKSYPPGIRGQLRLFEQKRRLRKVDAIITDSESSKKDIVRFLDVPADKIHVVYLAAGDNFRKLPSNSSSLIQTRKDYNLPHKFILYTGDVNYNKNIPMLIKASVAKKISLVIVGKHAKDVKDGFSNDLKDIRGPKDWLRYIAGKPHPELAHFQELSGLLNRNNVICTGFVSNSKLRDIYNLASVYCQPSYAEGFGLIVVEALVCGTQVVASHTQTLVEIAEDLAEFFDPNSQDDLESKLVTAISSPRKLNSDQIDKIKKKFNWKKTATQTIGVYKSLI